MTRENLHPDDLMERLREALDLVRSHAEKDLWVLDRATPGRWGANYGYNLPHSLILDEGGGEIARFVARASGPLPDGADDLHSADVLLVMRLVRKARERAEVALRTVQAHRTIVDRHTPATDLWTPVGKKPACVFCYQVSPCGDVRDVASIYFPEEAPE